MTATRADEASTPMIRAERLTKVYSAPNAGALLANFGRSMIGRPIQGARALDGVDFAVEPGEALGIVGRNGSGKSTLLQVLSGALQPTSGRLEIRGRLGTLLDLTSGINPEYSGAENAVVLGMLAGLSRREVMDRMDAIRAFSGLGDAFDRAVKSYSSGMGMRLGFSAAIHSDPEVLLIDEALAVGDAFYQQRCLRKMRALRDAGVTIVLVSHDPSAVISLCDRALWLESGRIQLAGAPKDVMRRYLAARYQDDCALDRELSSGAGLDATVSSEAIEPGAPLVRADERFGDGRARIVGFDVRDAEGTPRATFRPGDPTRVVLTVEVPDESDGLGHPLVGFTLRNRLGDVVTASNNELEGIALSPLGPGDRLDVAFDFAWPSLSGGPLSLSPAVAEGSIAAHAMSDWVENALVVETENPRGLFGWMTLEGVRVGSGAVRSRGAAGTAAPESATGEADASAGDASA